MPRAYADDDATLECPSGLHSLRSLTAPAEITITRARIHRARAIVVAPLILSSRNFMHPYQNAPDRSFLESIGIFGFRRPPTRGS